MEVEKREGGSCIGVMLGIEFGFSEQLSDNRSCILAIRFFRI